MILHNARLKKYFIYKAVLFSVFGIIATCGVILGQGVYTKAKATLANIFWEKVRDQALVRSEQPKSRLWGSVQPISYLPEHKYTSVVLDGISGEAVELGKNKYSIPPLEVTGASVISPQNTFLKKISVGDKIKVTNAKGKAYYFQVTKLKVVNFENSNIGQNASEQSLTFVTSWPLDSKSDGAMRYVVEAIRLVEPPVPTKKDQHES